MRFFVSVLLPCLVSTGCIAGSERGYPLYPVADVRPDANAVAHIGGYVRFVDGVDVSAHGTSFEVLPGCHLIGTPSRWGNVTANSGGVIATTGKIDFVLLTRPGQSYTIAVETGVASGPYTSIAVVGYERNA
jgi:predicted outer membrane repeat protein